MRKNPFEEALFKCEDERFELDIMIETAYFTLKLMENAHNEMKLLHPDQ